MSSMLSDSSQHNSYPRVYIYTACCIVLLLYILLQRPKKVSNGYPLVNHDSTAWTQRQAKLDYINKARTILQQAAAKFQGPFRIMTDSGPLLMLPPELIDAVNAEDHLSFNAYIREENLSRYSTFRTFRSPPPGMFEEAVLKGITRALPKYTKPLSKEMTQCLADTWGEADEWKETVAMSDVLKWVARLSNRIFLGPDFVNNQDWLRITTDFTTNLFTALGATKFFPAPLRPVIDLISPLNRKVRSDYHKAAAILAPVLQQRETEIREASQQGRKPDLPDDSIEWFRTAAKGQAFSQVDVQLGLAVAAIHTTSDLICQVLLNLCLYPEATRLLRDECIQVLTQHGLQKTSLLELRLLDSFIKETQRLKPIAMASMHRSATADVKLPGNIAVQKGEHLAISSHRMWDANEYANPDAFEPWRYAERRRVPGLEHKSLLVSTSHDHLGFAHGKHACPGRFFAANEVKLAILQVLLKYDIRLKDAADAKWRTYGVAMMANPEAKIQYRSRHPEINVDALANAL